MHKLGIIENYDNFLESYETHKDTLLDCIRSKTVSRGDIDDLINNNPDEFLWDVVFVDEGQDWPSNEIEIPRSIYKPEHIVVADGVDQYVRSFVADWSSGIAQDQLRPRRLRRCLRMKANLAHFVADCADTLGLQNWDLEPNPDANGGRVIIVEGDLAAQTTIYDQVCAEAAELGNYPIDLLACVPSSLVCSNGGGTYSVPGRTIRQNGGMVWDASAVDVREYIRQIGMHCALSSMTHAEGWKAEQSSSTLLMTSMSINSSNVWPHLKTLAVYLTEKKNFLLLMLHNWQ